MKKTEPASPAATGDEITEQKKMPLMAHLAELRYRIIVSLSAWAILSFAGWYLANPLLSYFTGRFGIEKINLILIRPTEAFMVRMKLAMAVGLVLAVPLIIYQLIAFVVPGLTKNEKSWTIRLIPASMILFYGGGAFSLFFMAPAALKFLLFSISQGIATPQISLEEYVNFITAMTLMGGFAFQTPVVLYFLTMIGILSSEKLRTGRKYAIVIIFIIAAIATPPDVFSQMMMAIPMLILYEICIWAAKLSGR